MPETAVFNEMLDADGNVRESYATVAQWLDGLPEGQLAQK